jgi:hypothetical protein
MMRNLTIFGVAVVLSVSCVAQTSSPAVPQRQNVEEDRVAQLIDAQRKEKGLKPLKRVAPSSYEVKLTCSSASTGKDLASLVQSTADLDAFQIYKTQELGDKTKTFNFLVSDEILRKKDFPQYSVIVFRDITTPTMLVVGISRRESKLGHWWGCSPLNIGHMTEDGCSDQGIPKPLIAPVCTEAK